MRVLIVDTDTGDRYRVVDTDQVGGARLAVQHLLDLGHETVWHVTGPEESFVGERRTQAWRATLEEAGRHVPEPVRGDWSADSGYAAGLALAELPDCTAVFATNDSVPEDVSVVGFVDVPDSAHFIPPLTTVHQDFTEVGRRSAVEALRQIRERTPATPGTDLVPTRLVVRRSTGPAPASAPATARTSDPASAPASTSAPTSRR
ncbi:substrate-binding domain-containing protein [Streptomyces sp. Je 1-369]|uniref:substrate-binding domain-containing protein n=1 Tax=Streptomyces sp. Je 1-369 TaxID=2966192 RepID=UPI002AA2B35F|nr:substrate-binding domain-containing protein [Streptomyces sp. Je 1-369]